jgi:hypothetical protein
MEVVESLILSLLFTGINIGLARYDAWRIKHNIRIRHAINALLYCILLIPFYRCLSIYNLIGLLLIRIPVFNTCLNVFRGLSATYISHTTTSIVDKIMNGVVEKLGYWVYHIIIYIIAIVLIFM